MKLWEKVNNITGNANKSRIIIDYVNQGAKFVVASLPEKFLWTIANEETINGHDGSSSVIGDGSSVPYDKILAVYRFDGSTVANNTVSSAGSKKRVCVEVSDQNIHIFDEANSLMRATKMFPKFYKLGGKIYIKPDPDYNVQTASTNAYTDVDGNTITVNAISGDKGVIVYSAPPIVDENTESWILAEFENIVIQYASSLDSMYQGGVQRDSALAALTLATTALSSFLSSFPSHSIRDIVKPLAPSSTFSDITPTTTLPNVPDFNSVSLPVSLSISTTLPETFEITEELPGDMVFTRTLPSLVMPSLSNDFSVTSSLPSALTMNTSLPSVVMPTEVDISYTEINDAHAKAKALVDDYGGIGGGDTTGEGDILVNSQAIKSSQQWLIEEDPEMVDSNLAVAAQELRRAGSELASEKSKLEEFQSEVGAAQQKFASESQKFQAELGKEQARIQQEVSTYQADLTTEQARIQEVVQKYSAEVQKESARAQTEVGNFQAELAKEQAKVQQEIQEYQADIQREVQEINTQIAKYSAEVQKEGAKAGVDVQVAQAEIAKLQATFQGDVTKYNTELSLKTNILQKEVQKYTNDLQLYSSNVQKYSAEVQGEVQAYASDIKKRERYIQEAGIQMQKSQQYMQISQQQYGLSGQYYQKAISELQAITGSLSAPPPQQAGQRQEERKSS